MGLLPESRHTNGAASRQAKCALSWPPIGAASWRVNRLLLDKLSGLLSLFPRQSNRRLYCATSTDIRGGAPSAYDCSASCKSPWASRTRRSTGFAPPSFSRIGWTPFGIAWCTAWMASTHSHREPVRRGAATSPEPDTTATKRARLNPAHTRARSWANGRSWR